MRNVILLFGRKDFEYDIYSLVKAFWPRSDPKICYAEEAAAGESRLMQEIGGDGLLMTFAYRADGLDVSLRDGAGQTVSRSAAAPYEEDRIVTKNILKRLVYEILSDYTGRTLPWGDLTGIRPVKIPMKMLGEGRRNTEIARYMRETYLVSPKKAALAIATANREKEILGRFDYTKGYSLYIGIPFCPSICLYCSFGSHPLSVWKKQVDVYLDALFRELAFLAEAMQDWRLDTIYIGGGTPTTLEPEQMRRLLRHVQESFDLSALREFTVEAGRPDTITEAKLAVLREFPVSRISINPQTMNQKTLDVIGRKHTVEEIREAFLTARRLGFSDINMDLIVGLPGEGEAEVAHTLEEIEKLAPDNLTVHSLALKRATRLNLFRDVYEDISFENSQEIMDLCGQSAMRMGMGPYYLYRQKNMAGNFENVGYAKLDKAGLYNILIMEERQTIMAAGAGASTKFVFDGGQRIERVENVKDVRSYIARIDEMIARKRDGIDKYLGRDAGILHDVAPQKA